MKLTTRTVLVVALLFAAAYITLVELILVWPLGSATTRLKAEHTIALLSSALTAAGLSALWLQLLATRHATEQAARADAERAATAMKVNADRAAAAALRFDELHMEFNSADIRVMRDLGWIYVKYITADADRTRDFARWWVLSEGRAPAPPKTLLRDAGLGHLGLQPLSNYTWAISVMVAFFVRIENRLFAHYGHDPIDPRALRVAVGPFFWEYWKPHLLMIATACDVAAVDASGKADRHEPPYFTRPLQSLAARFPGRSQAVAMSQDS